MYGSGLKTPRYPTRSLESILATLEGALVSETSPKCLIKPAKDSACVSVYCFPHQWKKSQRFLLVKVLFAHLIISLNHLGVLCVVSSYEDVGNELEWVILDKPLDGISQVSLKHALWLNYLLLVSVVVILHLQLVHVKVWNLLTPSQTLERTFWDQAESLALIRALHSQLELWAWGRDLLAQVATKLKCRYTQ